MSLHASINKYLKIQAYKYHAIINTRVKTNIYNTHTNIEFVRWAIYSHTFVESITDFSDFSLGCFTNSST